MSTFIVRAHSDPPCVDALCCWYKPVSENPTTLTKGCYNDSVALLPRSRLCSPGDPRLLECPLPGRWWEVSCLSCQSYLRTCHCHLGKNRNCSSSKGSQKVFREYRGDGRKRETKTEAEPATHSGVGKRDQCPPERTEEWSRESGNLWKQPGTDPGVQALLYFQLHLKVNTKPARLPCA